MKHFHILYLLLVSIVSIFVFIAGSIATHEFNTSCPHNLMKHFHILYVLQVSVNGNHYCEFNHRMTKEDVNTLEIGGDLTIQSIRYQGGPVRQ